MTAIQDKIKAAAAYLDANSTFKNWRTLVDADELDMYSAYDCIIGQIYGEYSTGKNILRDATSYSEWDEHCDAFGSYTEEWRAYLTTPQDEYAGQTFVMTGTQEKATVNHTFTVDGVRHVVYSFPGESFRCLKETEFTGRFSKPAKYVDRRLYTSKDRKDVFAYSAKRNEFFRFTSNGSFSPVTHGSMAYIESQYGPLLELVSTLDSLHGNVKGNIHVSYGE